MIQRSERPVVRSGYLGWKVPAAELKPMSAEEARDLVLECFYRAQHETFERQKQRLGVDWSESSVRRSVSGTVRAAFGRVGGDFDHPTRVALERAVECLATKARSWGTPPDIIEHHAGEIRSVLAYVRD